MTEPTNPLFEDEKDFLERKKLEYERALRGDVEEIKETTVQAGKIALVGAGVVGGIWLLAKAFGGGKARKKKHKHRKHRPEFEDYAGFDGFDENDQELNDLDTEFQSADYDYDPNYAYAGADADGFYTEGQGDTDYAAQDDDNGLSQYPDFPAHSAGHHDSDEDPSESSAASHDQETSYAYASGASYQARPYDDSRRLPHSDSFTEDDTATAHHEAAAEPAARTKSKLSIIGPALLSFAQSETGRVIVAQAAAVALALVTKAVQGIIPKHEAEADKNADLAASSASAGVSPATWPATSAQDASAAARHDDTLSYREPLA
ncbi:hypothetical protein [Hymenobacter cheonanensis]|uniref:hypothetical protein n=1 Tax=Hymenobacter sp. CA2-7 TaxID=3063993 RepID=UPI002712799A|nr:hypothetical protein [Hymenobacter sp. CA2-7]MDO7885900.1 hypothetical protein [Hymenobacter sp. CA2-7]